MDPSWFAFRARDARGAVVQLASVAGLAVGLFVALDRYGSTQLGGSDQVTQFAWLASIIGLATLPIGAAAGSDALLTWLGRRGSLAPAARERAALLVPPIAAAVIGLLLAPILFAVGGQTLYLVVAGIVFVLVAVAAVSGYVRRSATASGASGSEERRA